MGIETREDVTRVLLNPEAIEGLKALASANVEGSRAALPRGGVRIIASRAIDLSGELDCRAWECRMHQVDQLLGRLWLYFDQVVIADWLTPWLADEGQEIGDEERERLASDLSLFLRLWRRARRPS